MDLIRSALTDHLFSKDELEWINGAYGDSMSFMLCFGLKHYKDEDCDEAKAIVVAMMQDEVEDDDDAADILGLGSLSMGGKDADDDSETDAPRLLAESYFSREELEFINSGYGDVITFMLSFGLKFYKEEDCEEAQSIIAALLAQGDEGDDSDENEGGAGGKDKK